MSNENPQWSALLVDAVSQPGKIASAYSAFHNYSVANQLLALFECTARGIQPGPINTYKGWQGLGRYVKRGERALSLCCPVQCKRRPTTDCDDDDDNPTARPDTFTFFVYRSRFFVLAQTEGAEYGADPIPGWDEAAALAALDISRVSFDLLNGNVMGYASGRRVAVSPIAFHPHRTLIHELAHVVLGHTERAGGMLADDEPRREA